MTTCVLIHQDAALPELLDRFRRAEQEGFDIAFIADHTRDYRVPGGIWWDGWTVLTAAAQVTERIRIGTLVSNPILRPPQLLAREAHAVQHLSGGRLELGIGTGIAGFDFAGAGIEPWTPKVRARRFAEYVEVVAGILRGDGFSYAGEHFRTEHPPLVPAGRPPPITVGGQSPTVLRIAAATADCWNTHGPFGATADEILEITRRQNAQLDEACRAHGRDPSALRRSLLLVGPLAEGRAADTFARFSEAGIGEFVVAWTTDDVPQLP